ncbi:molybdopterin cofactor-binding domain-containing protein [Chryseolinea sp. H1M3-3]|uniref:xanthine dehydrogenase family protein molybdopterin-binding subunit n=1 Tax=Chryseolinea sp. H1M3-3 TaxID=3034144 RepID=UPI0023EAAAC3|nr:molybdopterin cofactor-binding domain-containing protein [Chryseolinea sp. H1M3-3]
MPISRRNFIKLSGLSGVALTLGICVPSAGKNIIQVINANTTGGMGIELQSWISIDISGIVTIMTHRSEMGQGTFQAIPQMVAEELEVNLDQCNVNFVPANPGKFGPQPQEGSYSVRGWYRQLLQAGASAREMFIEAAAARWRTTASECYAENGSVIHRSSGQKFGYGELIADAAKLTPPQNARLKNRKDYNIIGKPLPRKDIPLKTNGMAVFGMDKRLPGMLYAVVERSPRFCGKVKSINDSETISVKGVKHVFKIQRAVFENLYEGVAVVADTLWAAMEGRKVLKIEWDDEGFEHLNTETIFSRMHADVSALLELPHAPTRFERAFPEATKKIESTYEAPYQSHSCMEPVNCIAHVEADRIEIWGPIQEVNWIQNDLSARMGIPTENITVNMTFLGGGFGRKAFPDYPHEAALISQKINAPVQVVWTREDDMTAGPFRPGAVYKCKGGLDKHGKILAFQTLMAAQAFWPNPTPAPPSDNDMVGILDGLAKPYLQSIPNFSFGYAPTKAPIPVMWWRSVYASTNAFAVESFIDELAHQARQDPLQFRRTHLDNPRYQAIIDKIEHVGDWKLHTKKQGQGVAITECFGGIVAHVVKVSRGRDKKIKIDKVIAIIDCGWYVNPDTIRAQLEGSIVMALAAAYKHETHFQDGKAVEKNFDRYKMPRISDIPDIEAHIMENDEPPGGVGEPGFPPLAPALCNAIFDLTGKRIRKLPFDMDAL